MIKVLVKQNNNQIVNLSITGHADSGEYGKDLVCAGVSTVGIGAMNMLAKKGFLAKGLGTIEINEGYINVVVNHTDEVCQVVLETLVVTLETMVESYGRFIKISKVEMCIRDSRYSVDEEIIRNYNQDKALEAGSVLIIPYVP